MNEPYEFFFHFMVPPLKKFAPQIFFSDGVKKFWAVSLEKHFFNIFTSQDRP